MTTQTRQLFGTDGIRGVAGEFPLTQDSTYMIGRALGHDLKRAGGPARVVIGQDTRQSSAWIADRVTHGLTASGVEVHSAGRHHHAGRGLPGALPQIRMPAWSSRRRTIPGPTTASRFFPAMATSCRTPTRSPSNRKSSPCCRTRKPTWIRPSSFRRALPGQAELRQAYIAWLAKNVSADLSRLRVLVDCANGAAAAEAPELFRLCRIPATFLSASPDGQNINDNCGALHPETVARAVAEKPGQFDLGVTFDGDADRALFCDADGRVVNGDAVLLLTARYMKAQGALPGETVVATTMSNMGLEIALRNSGIRLLRANVGDKYVLEEMQKTGAVLGGEQSGHIIFRDGEATTGDGLLTALRVMETMARTGKPLAELVSDLKVFPQTIQNVRVREKVPFAKVPDIQKAIADAERELNGNGRVVVRYSGTEGLARVMIEAESEEKMKALAQNIAGAIKSALGA